MDANPFAILTFIVAPAILTNASSMMALGTSNRFARAIDRVRAISAHLEKRDLAPDEAALWISQMEFGERRALMLVRALNAFYLAVGAFGAAVLVSLFGAILSLTHEALWGWVISGFALLSGSLGVGGLVTGATLLVLETRATLRVLHEETQFLIRRSAR